MKTAIGIVAVLGAFLAASAVSAQEQGPEPEQKPPQQAGNWYISGFAGGAFLRGAKNQGAEGNFLNVEDSNSPGYGVRAAFGGYRTPQVRVEGEVAYRRAGFDGVSVINDGGLGTVAGAGSLNGLHSAGTGHVSALSFMANAYYDYDTNSPWRPYIALGLGFARVALDNFQFAGVPIADDGSWVFAYQMGFGIGYEITASTTLALDYRYFTTLDPTLRDAAGGKFSTDFTSHNLSLGIRYRF